MAPSSKNSKPYPHQVVVTVNQFGSKFISAVCHNVTGAVVKAACLESRGLEPHSGLQVSKKQNSHPLTCKDIIYNIVWCLRDREVACFASDRQGSNFESRFCRALSSYLSHHLHKVLRAQFNR